MNAAANQLDQYNVTWTSQSRNASESMPVSGGDIGLNVWVENDELLVYLGQAGCRDENGALLKPGRVRIKLTPNPFENAGFRQELKLREGHVLVTAEQPDGKELAIKVWVEVGRPIVHLDVESDTPVTAAATYESWRTEDIELPNDRSKHARRAMCMINYDAYPGKVYLYKDEIRAGETLVRFHHRVDNSKDSFDFQVKQQGLEPVRDQLVNPLEHLVWGGVLVGDDFALTGETSGTYAQTPFKGWKYVGKAPATSHRVRVCLHVDQVEKQATWDGALQELVDRSPKDDVKAWEESQAWWSEFWNRSHLVVNDRRGEKDAGWRIGRNYQLFRYMLASNVNGREPTLFNGGLFTFDPLYVNGRKGPGYTPDHRQWGAAFTAQNQRMMVWPLLKTGDFDFFPTAFSFYLNGLPNTMARVRHYWKHDGCCFEEQSAITGLPGACQYGFFEGGRRGRPKDFQVGVQVNRAGGMVYEAQLEYSWLMLRYHQFSGADLSAYLPFVEQSVLFYDEHYRYRCSQLTGKELDENGKLAIYPANTLEAHWNARNPTSVIAGLRRVLSELVNLPEKYTSAEKRKRWQRMLDRLPDMPTGSNDKYGGRYLKPAENHNHKSWHCPEMFPLFPYELYGLGLPDLELMKRTSLSTGKDRYKTVAWEQANIHAPRLGDAALARRLNTKKMDNGPFRFPAFWPHNIDWAPDHNWGGSGMIGMQEMVMQTHSAPGKRGKIRLLPAWPKEWDVDFKLHAPYETTLEGKARSGEVVSLEVTPEERRMDVMVVANGVEERQGLRKEWGPFVGPWVRHDRNPIITLEGKETYSIQNGPQSVIRWQGKWHMFLMTSQPMVTKLAVSDDGLTWKRPHHEYLLKAEMPWEGTYNLAKAAVIRDDEVWIYYFGKKSKREMIALARSRDLVNWRKEPEPIFTHRDSRIKGERAFPDCVIEEGDTWYMFYDVGWDYHHPKNPDGYAIGVATSTDGITWRDSPKSPVLTTSERTPDSWDDGMVSQCSVHKIGDRFFMLYSGSTNKHGRKHSGKNRMAFGLARARHPEGPWEKYPHNPVFGATGNVKDFDGVFLQHACPVKVGDQWRLYYNGWTLNPEARNPIKAEYAIGVAVTKE